MTGVRTGHGDLDADLVIDATGRRTPIDRWLGQIGARPTVTRRAECGIAYYSRHYRVRANEPLPGSALTRFIEALDEFNVGVLGADNGAMQVVVAPLTIDRRFRALRHAEVFTAVLRTVPAVAAWLDVLDPISGIFQMGGLHNTLRRLVADGAPVVTGLHAIGDAVCATNPTFGRGLILAIWGAANLADVIARYGEDWTAQALALDELVTDHIAPSYEEQTAIDAGRLRMQKHAIFNAPAPTPPPAAADRISFQQLHTAASFDPVAFRALWEIFGMIRTPDEVYTDPRVVTRTHDVLRQHPGRPRVAQPNRETLLAALAS